MAEKATLADRLRFPAGQPSALAGIDPDSTPGIRGRKQARDQLHHDRKVLAGLQDRLYAENRRSLLLVLQGIDTSGKDGVVRHVVSAFNPMGCRITSFKQPTADEQAHDFLWRIDRALPSPRYVGVFNRSHYEDVVVVRVHELVTEATWRARYAQINEWEARLVEGGTALVKVFLHISYDEQRRRLLARLDDRAKRWKFNPADLAERQRWADYQAAYADALAACSTPTAPWFVVPADHKWYRNWAVGRLLTNALERMDPRYPEPDYDIDAMRQRLRS